MVMGDKRCLPAVLTLTPEVPPGPAPLNGAQPLGYSSLMMSPQPAPRGLVVQDNA
jgi:hypothetical protein